jgi:hypothetical protein
MITDYGNVKIGDQVIVQRNDESKVAIITRLIPSGTRSVWVTYQVQYGEMVATFAKLRRITTKVIVYNRN